MVEFAVTSSFRHEYKKFDIATRDLIRILSHRVINWIYVSWDEGCKINNMTLTVPIIDNTLMAFSYDGGDDILMAKKIYDPEPRG